MDPNIPYDTTDEDEYVITVVNPTRKKMAKKKTSKKKAAKRKAAKKKTSSKKTAKRKAAKKKTSSKKTAKRKATKKTSSKKTAKRKAAKKKTSSKKTAKRKAAKKTSSKKESTEKLSMSELRKYTADDIEKQRKKLSRAKTKRQWLEARGRLGGMASVRATKSLKRKTGKMAGRFAGRVPLKEKVDMQKFDVYPNPGRPLRRRRRRLSRDFDLYEPPRSIRRRNPAIERDRARLKAKIRAVLEEQERELRTNPSYDFTRARQKLTKFAEKNPGVNVNQLVRELQKMVGG